MRFFGALGACERFAWRVYYLTLRCTISRPSWEKITTNAAFYTPKTLGFGTLGFGTLGFGTLGHGTLGHGALWWSSIGISPFFSIVWPSNGGSKVASKRVCRFCIIYRGKLSISPFSLCVFSALWYKNRLMIKYACEKSTARSSGGREPVQGGMNQFVRVRLHVVTWKACISICIFNIW